MNEWILRLLKLILSVASPELRKMLEQFLDQLEKQAKATKNPWDDILVALLRQLILGDDKPARQ